MNSLTNYADRSARREDLRIEFRWLMMSSVALIGGDSIDRLLVYPGKHFHHQLLSGFVRHSERSRHRQPIHHPGERLCFPLRHVSCKAMSIPPPSPTYYPMEIQ